MEITYQYIGGAKGGSETRTPVEAPDTLVSTAYLKILDLLCEGPIEDEPRAYYDYTPVKNDSGVYNFENVSNDWRPGTQDQSYITGYPSVENETSVSLKVEQGTPIVRTVSGAELSAVRVTISTPSMYKTNTTNGDINGTTVNYAIDVATDGGAYSTKVSGAFVGKCTDTYQRSIRIDLPAGSTWQIRMRRLTADSSSSALVNDIYFDSITEIIDVKLRYPNSVLYASTISAEQFSSVPSRQWFGKWRLMPVPANYDPITRVYATSGTGTTGGVWDGTFKIAWTNNPAWIYRDILTNDRFGLGAYIDASQIDDYRLYVIAQYCDEMVSDGLGGLEPRFTSFVCIASQEDAFKVLQDLASTFRGITYYMAGVYAANIDAPQDPIYQYTKANVKDGSFVYSGSSRSARHTMAMVSWNDPDDFGRAKVEPVVYQPGVARYGINPTTVTAFGATSRSQAQRVGNHILASENFETEVVTFTVGLEGAVVAPGDVFEIADADRAGRRAGGRVVSHVGNVVQVDKAAPEFQVGDTLQLTMPSTGRTQSRTISDIDGDLLTVSMAFSEQVLPTSVWTVRSSDLALQTFRCLDVTENNDGDFEISGLTYVEAKFAYIDNGTKIELPPTSVIPPGVQDPPTDVAISSVTVVDQGIAKQNARITWTKAANAIRYQVYWKRDDNPYVQISNVGTTSVDIENVYAGNYVVRVFAEGPTGVLSLPAYSLATDILGKTTLPPALSSLTTSSLVFGIKVSWGFPADTSDTAYTEIRYGSSSSFAAAGVLGSYAYPTDNVTLQGLQAGAQFFFWGRLIDKSGNVGPWYPVETGAGVVGTSSTDVSAIESYVLGEIDKTWLGQQLQDTIDLVDPDMAGDATTFAGDDTRYAGVWTYVSAAQADNMAQAIRIDTIQATVDDTTAAVQQISETVVDLDGQISATYTVRAQITSAGQIYMAGMGVGVEQQADGSYQSQILMLADRFALLTAASGGSVSIPFFVESGQTFIQSAFIKDGTITNAKVGDLQSTNYVAGASGWRLAKDGSFERNGVSGSSKRLSTVLKDEIYDDSGVKRVAIGVDI